MEVSQAFQSCHFAVPSPCGRYIASLTQQNLYIQYAQTLLPAFTFPLDDPSQPKIVAENQSIQWSAASTYLSLVSTQAVHLYSLGNSTLDIHVTNGSASLGRIHSAELLGDSGRESLMVVWEFGRVNIWDLSTGRATDLGDLKMGGKGGSWALRRNRGRQEVLALLMRKDAQDVISLFLPPSLTPFRTITLSTVDVQSLRWSPCGQWLSILDSALATRQVHILTADGCPFRQYPPQSQPTPPTTPEEKSEPSLGFRSLTWSGNSVALSEAQSMVMLNTRTFAHKFTISLSSIHTETRSLDDGVIAYQEIINAAGERSYDTLTGQNIPIPNPRTCIIDVRSNRAGRYLSCRDEGIPSALYILDLYKHRVHSIAMQHAAIRRAVWHPGRASLKMILSEHGSIHLWDVDCEAAPVHVPHNFENRPDAGRVEAKWLHASSEDKDAELDKNKLCILVTSRRGGFELVWPEGRPSSSIQGGNTLEEGDVSHDSLYDILTGRTPLPELKVQRVEAEVDAEKTEKLDDTFRGKAFHPDLVEERQDRSIEDDSDIF